MVPEGAQLPEALRGRVLGGQSCEEPQGAGHSTCPTRTGLRLRPQGVVLRGSKAQKQDGGRRPGPETVRGAVRKGDRASPQTSCPHPRGRQSRVRAGRARSTAGSRHPPPPGQTRTSCPGPRTPSLSRCPQASLHRPTPWPPAHLLPRGARGYIPQLLPQLLQLLHGDLGGCGRGTKAGSAAGRSAGRKLCSLLGVLLQVLQGLKTRGPSVTLATHGRPRRARLPRPPPAARPAGPPAAAGSPQAARHELPRPQVTGQDPTPISHGSACPLQVASLPCCARPHPFKGPGVGPPGAPEQTLGLMTREEALPSPAHPGATAHTLHAHVSVSQVTHAQFKRGKQTRHGRHSPSAPEVTVNTPCAHHHQDPLPLGCT